MTTLDTDVCTTRDVSHRHRAGTLTVPAGNQFLGAVGRRGTTACGQSDALDEPELAMWYAEWGVPPARRRVIADLPECSTCYPKAT